MFTVQIADLRIAIDNKYEAVERLCTPYKCADGYYDILVSTTDEDIKTERLNAEFDVPDENLESVCIYRHIAKQLPQYDAFVMHSAVIEYNGKAYCFAARSGTGKTTHIMLWKRLFGDKISIINGDKPIMRFINGQLYAYGTPWCGKEQLQTNTSAPLCGICFLKQAPLNSIIKLTAHEALNKLLLQVYFPKDTISASLTVDLIGKMLNQTPVWLLNCNVSNEAAEMSFKTMCEKD